jgi:RsmE family RNA methyltransferase
MKHIFAIYIPKRQIQVRQTNHVVGDQPTNSYFLEAYDKEAYLRVSKVLRLKKSEHLQLFDENNTNYIISLEDLKDRHHICGKLLQVNTHNQSRLLPSIKVAVNLVKKEQFEDICYAATVFGVSQIIPLISQKIHSKNANYYFFEKHKTDRLEKICIAAAEQSKQFLLPVISQPISLTSFLSYHQSLEHFNSNEGNKPLSCATKTAYFHMDPSGSPILSALKPFEHLLIHSKDNYNNYNSNNNNIDINNNNININNNNLMHNFEKQHNLLRERIYDYSKPPSENNRNNMNEGEGEGEGEGGRSGNDGDDNEDVDVNNVSVREEKDEIVMLFGGEAGFSDEEEKRIRDSNLFQSVRLTKSILKAKDAVSVALGFIRSTLS